MAAIALGVVYLVGQNGPLHRYALLRTYTDDAGGLSVGSIVRLNGISVGYLDKLLLTNSRNRNRKVELDLRVRPSALNDIPVDSTAGVAASSLAGDYYINIVKGRAARHVQAGDELPPRLPEDTGAMMAQMQHILQEFDNLAARADGLLIGVEHGEGTLGKWITGKSRLPTLQAQVQGIENDISNGHGTLGLLMSGDLGQQMQGTEDRFNAITAAIGNGRGTAGQMSSLMREANAEMQEIDGVVKEMQSAKGPGARFDELSQKADALMGKVNGIFDRIQSGQGTLGQFTINPQFSDALAGMQREAQGLVQEMRKNPTKMLSFQFRIF